MCLVFGLVNDLSLNCVLISTENSSKKRKKCEDTDPDVGLKKIKLSVTNPIDGSEDENG